MKFLSIRSFQYPGQTRARWTRSDQFEVWALELQSTVHKDFAIMERPLLEIGTPGQVKYHIGHVAIKIYANQTTHPFRLVSQFHVYLPWVKVCLAQCL